MPVVLVDRGLGRGGARGWQKTDLRLPPGSLGEGVCFPACPGSPSVVLEAREDKDLWHHSGRVAWQEGECQGLGEGEGMGTTHAEFFPCAGTSPITTPEPVQGCHVLPSLWSNGGLG